MVKILDDNPFGKLERSRLIEFEKKFKIRLPSDYRAFLLKHNGGRPQPNTLQVCPNHGPDEGKKMKKVLLGFFAIHDQPSGHLKSPVDPAQPLQAVVKYVRKLDKDRRSIPVAVDAQGNLIELLCDPDPDLHGRMFYTDLRRDRSYPFRAKFTQMLGKLRTNTAVEKQPRLSARALPKPKPESSQPAAPPKSPRKGKPRKPPAIRDSQRFGPLTKARLEKLEKQLKAKLPADYRQFLLTHNGGRPDRQKLVCWIDGSTEPTVLEWLFAVHDQPYDDEDFHAAADGFMSYFAQPLEDVWSDFRSELPRSGTLPIGRDPGGNLICLGHSGARAGKVFFYHHEMQQLYPLAESFTELLGNLDS